MVRLDLLAQGRYACIGYECGVQCVLCLPGRGRRMCPERTPSRGLPGNRAGAKTVPVTEELHVDVLASYPWPQRTEVVWSGRGMAPERSNERVNMDHDDMAISHDTRVHLLVRASFEEGYLASSRLFSGRSK